MQYKSVDDSLVLLKEAGIQFSIIIRENSSLTPVIGGGDVNLLAAKKIYLDLKSNL